MRANILIEDQHSIGRGFFSTLNLLMFAIIWSDAAGFNPIVGRSLFSAYAHPLLSKYSRHSPFNTFWLCEYGSLSEEAPASILDIGDIFLTRDWYNDVDCLPRLRELAQMFMGEFLAKRAKCYLDAKPVLISKGKLAKDTSASSFEALQTVSVHYRGCDYLANVPHGHEQNHDPRLYAELIAKKVPLDSHLFVATDDVSFLKILAEYSYSFLSFNDVERGKPGRGIHQKSRRQRLGIEKFDQPWLRGVQVMRDCLYLSKGETYIGTNSNLMFFASLLNPQINIVNLMKV